MRPTVLAEGTNASCRETDDRQIMLRRNV